MHSSPELDAAADAPSTPHNAASFALGPAAELSPPNSHGRLPDENLSALAGGAPSMINANGKRAHPSSVANVTDKKSRLQTDPATGYQWSSADDAPGYEWKTNRAREDEARALEAVVDKGSMIKSKLLLRAPCRRADVSVQLATATLSSHLCP